MARTKHCDVIIKETIRNSILFLTRRTRNSLVVILLMFALLAARAYVKTRSFRHNSLRLKARYESLSETKDDIYQLLLKRRNVQGSISNEAFNDVTEKITVQKSDPNTLPFTFRQKDGWQTLSANVDIEGGSSHDNTYVDATAHDTTVSRLHTQHSKSQPRSDFEKVDRRNIWLRNFTKDLPYELTLLLQDILERDFEKDHKLKSGTDDPGRCKHGYFKLKNMESCLEWLKCDEINALKTEDIYGNGGVKIIHSAKWKGIHDVAVVSLRKDRQELQRYVDRAQSGVDNILLTQPSPYATQVVGHCAKGNSTILVTEACEYGSFQSFYMGPVFKNLSTIARFKFAIQVVAEFDYLHRGLGLPRIYCDMHTIRKAFNQFLVSSDLRLFLNDLDDMPVVNKADNKLGGCKNERMGIMSYPEFLSPEIRYTVEEYHNRTHKKLVDEKSDVWKIPDLTANIMNSNMAAMPVYVKRLPSYASNLRYDLETELKSIHDKCKRLNPNERPTSREILIFYMKIYKQLLLDSIDN